LALKSTITMAILNYTTKISAMKTVGEIGEILSSQKARKITFDNDADGNPVSITFCLMVGDNMFAFCLTANWQGVQKALIKENVKNEYRSKEQAIRVSWMIIKDWTEAQLAIIEAGQASLAEVFLPYAMNKDGVIMKDLLLKDKTLFLNQ
jgi:predicted HAD superfamily phosphohydrolase YqeG